MKEIWKPIKGYELSHIVSNLGNVKSLRRSVNSKLTITEQGYLRVGLQHNRIGGLFYVHRLVAEAFIVNTHDKPEVNHKNGKKYDNRKINLEWVTSLENTQHAIANGLFIGQGGNGKGGSKFGNYGANKGMRYKTKKPRISPG